MTPTLCVSPLTPSHPCHASAVLLRCVRMLCHVECVCLCKVRVCVSLARDGAPYQAGSEQARRTCAQPLLEKRTFSSLDSPSHTRVPLRLRRTAAHRSPPHALPVSLHCLASRECGACFAPLVPSPLTLSPAHLSPFGLGAAGGGPDHQLVCKGRIAAVQDDWRYALALSFSTAALCQPTSNRWNPPPHSVPLRAAPPSLWPSRPHLRACACLMAAVCRARPTSLFAGAIVLIALLVLVICGMQLVAALTGFV
jgi:hypothetical protein